VKVRISGYQLTYHPLVNLGTLSRELQRRQGERIRFQGHDRILHITQDAKHVVGSLLTDRGHKNFVAIHTETNQLSRGTLGANKNFGAFNFFLLCKQRDAGIITSYRDAGGPSFVFGVLAMIGDAALQAGLQREIEQLGPGITQRQRNQLLTRHEPPSLSWIEVLGREEYDAALQRWKRIRSIEVTFKAAAGHADFVPADDDALDNSRTNLSFRRGISVARAIESVKSVWNRSRRADAETVKVDGVDEWGLNRRVELAEKIPSLFGELDHDSIIADPTSFGADLPASFVVRHLKEIARQSPAIFG
jgi:hypothetical protein